MMWLISSLTYFQMSICAAAVGYFRPWHTSRCRFVLLPWVILSLTDFQMSLCAAAVGYFVPDILPDVSLYCCCGLFCLWQTSRCRFVLLLWVISSLTDFHMSLCATIVDLFVPDRLTHICLCCCCGLFRPWQTSRCLFVMFLWLIY